MLGRFSRVSSWQVLWPYLIAMWHDFFNLPCINVLEGYPLILFEDSSIPTVSLENNPLQFDMFPLVKLIYQYALPHRTVQWS